MIDIKIDATSGVEGLNALAAAVERVNTAIDELQGNRFGSMTIHVVGSIATVEVTQEGGCANHAKILNDLERGVRPAGNRFRL